MIDEGIVRGKFPETNDTTHADLKHFQDFLYDEIRPVSNLPARFFVTTKTHKFKSLEEINVDQLKLRPIIDQTGTYIYNASKVIAKYLKPLAKNEYTISDTLTFPDLVKNASNSNEYEDLSYDVECLFTSIPVEETINYVVDRIYVRKEIQPLLKKSIFKKLLFKLTKECVFSVTEKLLKQVDGCPLWVGQHLFSDIFMCKMELDVVVPAKPISYKRYVDDTYVRRKKNDADKLFEELNSYNKNIKLTSEVNPTKFLDTELVRENGEITT